jgi:hypothetical protein
MAPTSAHRREQEFNYYQAKAQFTKAFANALKSAPERPAETRDVSSIIPGLLLSGKDVEANYGLLSEQSVTHILQVRGRQVQWGCSVSCSQTRSTTSTGPDPCCWHPTI